MIGRFGIVRVALAVSLALSVFLVGAAMLGSRGVVQHEKLRDELANVHALNDTLANENRRLRDEAKALRSSPEYIESVIRDELGFVRKDEIVIIFQGDTKR